MTLEPTPAAPTPARSTPGPVKARERVQAAARQLSAALRAHTEAVKAFHDANPDFRGFVIHEELYAAVEAAQRDLEAELRHAAAG